MEVTIIFFDYFHLKNFEWPDSDDQDESDEFDHDKVEDTDDESEMDDDEKMELSSNCTVQNLTYANWVRIIDQR